MSPLFSPFSLAGLPLTNRIVMAPLTRSRAANDVATEVLRNAALAGLGIGQLATFLIADELRERTLMRVLADVTSEGEPLSVVYPARRLLPPKVKSFVDLLLASWQPLPPWDRPGWRPRTGRRHRTPVRSRSVRLTD